MQKSYLLLRNNQQSGPYSLDEVKQLPLQPKDLIWIIGQSAGWRFPEEIESLTQTVSISSDTVPTLPSALTSNQSFTLSKNTDAQKRVYVSMPSESKALIGVEAAILDSEAGTLSFEERVDKMRQRVASVQTSTAANNVETDVKYSRSLEDIKAEYSTWLHTQKQKRKINIGVKHLRFPALLIGIVALAFLLPKAIGVLDSSPIVIQKESIAAEKKIVNMAGIALTGKSSVVSLGKHDGYATGTVKKKAVQSRKSIKKEDASSRIKEVEHPLEMNPVLEKSPSPVISSEQPKINVAKEIQVTADYITSQKQIGIGGLAVTIKNNSTQFVKVIAVDIIYYTEAMKEIDRKTLYYSNLSPGVAMTLTAPAHKKAEGAFAQVGLISTENGGIFYAGHK